MKVSKGILKWFIITSLLACVMLYGVFVVTTGYAISKAFFFCLGALGGIALFCKYRDMTKEKKEENKYVYLFLLAVCVYVSVLSFLSLLR
jgi:hypothetical protein